MAASRPRPTRITTRLSATILSHSSVGVVVWRGSPPDGTRRLTWPSLPATRRARSNTGATDTAMVKGPLCRGAPTAPASDEAPCHEPREHDVIPTVVHGLKLPWQGECIPSRPMTTSPDNGPDARSYCFAGQCPYLGRHRRLPEDGRHAPQSSQVGQAGSRRMAHGAIPFTHESHDAPSAGVGAPRPCPCQSGQQEGGRPRGRPTSKRRGFRGAHWRPPPSDAEGRSAAPSPTLEIRR